MYLQTKYDVVIVGGGPAGFVAAIAASRLGAKTLLVEETSFLGGPATFGMPLHTFYSFKGERVIDGIAQEFVDRLIDIRGCTGHVSVPGDISPTYTLVDSEAVKYVAQQMVVEAGADILFHTRAHNVLLNSTRSAVEGVLVQHKEREEGILAGVVVDCSGDGDMAFHSGVEMNKGNAEGKMQALTMNFRVGGVDLKSASKWLHNSSCKAVKPAETEASFFRGWGDFHPWKAKLDGLGIFTDANNRLYANSFRNGELNCNTIKITGVDATCPTQRSMAEVEARKKVWQLFEFMRENCPGFEKAYIISTACFVGIRETRRIVGEYILNTEDVLHGRTFEDGIAKNAYPIDIHDPDTGMISIQKVGGNGYYHIPYRCLIPKKGIQGIIVAGRNISTTHEALGSVRVMACCMALGQAAGTAAALAISKGIGLKDMPVPLLQKKLIENKASL